jgi:hypothetical protein
VACACPGTPQISELLGGDEAVEELQKTALVVLTEVPLEGLEETAVAAMTEVPAEDLMKTAEAMATTMPGGEGIMETAQAEFGAIPGLGDSGGTGDTPAGEPPPDIPVLEDNQNMFANRDLVTYSSSVPYDVAIEFYKTEMAANGWDLPQGSAFETEDTTVMIFEKPDRMATVSVIHNGNATDVMITIMPK